MKKISSLALGLISIVTVGVTTVNIFAAMADTTQSPKSTSVTPKPSESPGDGVLKLDPPKVNMRLEALEKKLDSLEKKNEKSTLDLISSFLSIINFLGLGGLILYFFMSYRSKVDRLIDSNKRKVNELSQNLEQNKRDASVVKTNLDQKFNSIEGRQQQLGNDIVKLERQIKESKESRQVNNPPSNYSNKPISSSHSSSEHHQSVYVPVSYLDVYNDRSKNFTDNYSIETVDRNVENYKLGFTGQTQDIILNTESRGKYWLYLDGEKIYLLPKQKMKVPEDQLSQVEELFDCNNYHEHNYDNFTLTKPAVLISQGSGNNQTWKLIEKGTLQFV
jgi:hypothetical protein